MQKNLSLVSDQNSKTLDSSLSNYLNSYMLDKYKKENEKKLIVNTIY